MFLSIIVPVYNVEAYLERCVSSLLDQDIDRDDYEIIFINDGSTDGSGTLCDKMAGQNQNIRVIHKENGGLSSARNAGIRAATGNFIQFVDSDDYLCHNVLGSLKRQIIEQDLDILRYNYQNVREDGSVFDPNKVSKPFVDYSPEVCGGEEFLNERLGYACYACQFVIKAALLKGDDSLFKEGIYFEDVDWTPRVILKAGRVASTTTMVYNYLFREGSISRSFIPEKRRKKVSDQLYLIESLERTSQNGTDQRWFKGMVAQISLSIILAVSQSFYGERKEYVSQLKKRKVFPLSTYHATKAALWKIKLANLSPMLLCHTLRILNNLR